MKFWDYKKDSIILGEYKGWIAQFGPFKSRVYVIKNSKGHNIGVWSNQRLTELLYGVPFGTQIKIKYLGKVQMPGQTFASNNYSLEVTEKMEGSADVDAPPPEDHLFDDKKKKSRSAPRIAKRRSARTGRKT